MKKHKCDSESKCRVKVDGYEIIIHNSDISYHL